MDEKVFLPGTIGERMKDLRTARGITIKELAEKAGLDYSTLSRIENGKIQKVADDVVLMLAKFFNVSTDFLLGLTNIPDKKNYPIRAWWTIRWQICCCPIRISLR